MFHELGHGRLPPRGRSLPLTVHQIRWLRELIPVPVGGVHGRRTQRSTRLDA
ncbi:hypothetical protein STRIP9103_02654 [Streptomyces ipomoeae 91-03]|uniref:Uncharacterized protein n=1 Tax=Streptomyces ipomoeae 91-03 TaxID=698759 RepID=L1KVN0_9ACTN|nr:hypothetical protein STRIP9103_02654 [Streptomyces ipomoeae 91-03]